MTGTFASTREPSVYSTAACGYLPFGEYVESDHRFSYIDLHTTSVFGDPAKLAPFPERDIQANNPALVTVGDRLLG